MPKWIKFILYLLTIVFLTSLHVGLNYLLPYPWSKLNTLFCFFIIFLLWKNFGVVVWLVFLAHFLIELYSSSPFGVILFSSVMAFLISYWLFQTVFTNRSWYATLALTFFTLFVYRAFYTIIIFLLSSFGLMEVFSWKLVLLTWFWEQLITILAVLVIYFILAKVSKTFKSGSIIEGNIYGKW